MKTFFLVVMVIVTGVVLFTNDSMVLKLAMLASTVTALVCDTESGDE